MGGAPSTSPASSATLGGGDAGKAAMVADEAEVIPVAVADTVATASVAGAVAGAVGATALATNGSGVMVGPDMGAAIGIAAEVTSSSPFLAAGLAAKGVSSAAVAMSCPTDAVGAERVGSWLIAASATWPAGSRAVVASVAVLAWDDAAPPFGIEGLGPAGLEETIVSGAATATATIGASLAI